MGIKEEETDVFIALVDNIWKIRRGKLRSWIKIFRKNVDNVKNENKQ